MSLNGSVYIVHLMEVDLTQVRFDQDKKIIWPHTIGETGVFFISRAHLTKLVLPAFSSPATAIVTSGAQDSVKRRRYVSNWTRTLEWSVATVFRELQADSSLGVSYQRKRNCQPEAL
jgi:hypothetical protein